MYTIFQYASEDLKVPKDYGYVSERGYWILKLAFVNGTLTSLNQLWVRDKDRASLSQSVLMHFSTQFDPTVTGSLAPIFER